MAYPMYPQNYPQFPAYQPYQQPVMQATPQQVPQMNSFQNGTGSPPAPQAMTPPTIHAEIIQIDDESAVERWPVNAGASQMFITKAEDRIIIKTMGPNGPLPLDVYDKRPPAPPEPVFDPAAYVRRDELPELVAAAVAATAKKEAAEA